MILAYIIALILFSVVANIIPFGLMNYFAGKTNDQPLFVWVSIILYLFACFTMLGAPFVFLIYFEGKYAFDPFWALILGILCALPSHAFFHFKYVKKREIKRDDWLRFLAGLISFVVMICTMMAPLALYFFATGTPLTERPPNYNNGLILLILGGGLGAGMVFFVYDFICRKFQIIQRSQTHNK